MLCSCAATVTTKGDESLDQALGVLLAADMLNVEDFYSSLVIRNQLANLRYGDQSTLSDGSPVLRSQRYYLSEHHLYGSSRLSIKSYWPEQYYSYWEHTKQKVENGRVITYSGRTSGWYSGTEPTLEDARIAVERCDAGHLVLKSEGYSRARLDKHSSNRAEIRGCEQQLVDY